jgi:hypothetical protein
VGGARGTGVAQAVAPCSVAEIDAREQSGFREVAQVTEDRRRIDTAFGEKCCDFAVRGARALPSASRTATRGVVTRKPARRI